MNTIVMSHLRAVTNADEQPDPRNPEVYRGGLASARAALRDGVSRRYRHDHDKAGDDPQDPQDPQDRAQERDA
jgi:hypothetical protein